MLSVLCFSSPVLFNPGITVDNNPFLPMYAPMRHIAIRILLSCNTFRSGLSREFWILGYRICFNDKPMVNILKITEGSVIGLHATLLLAKGPGQPDHYGSGS